MKLDKKILVILICTFIFWLWNAGSIDLVGDDAIYSFRALGYFDYLAADEQSGPIQWFGSIPWWANLSFHDAPPLVFLIQKIFFSLVGDNAIVARLPGILSLLASIYLIFAVGREIISKRAGYLAAGLMAVLGLSSYSALSGYLEGLEILFITLSLFFWIKFLKYGNKYLIGWGVTLGLALITKYTAFFLVPFYFVYLLIYRRDVFRKKEFYIAMAIVLILFSPVIVFNLELYATRGHLDAVFSSLFGMETNDFKTLAERSLNLNFGQVLWSIAGQLGRQISLGWLMVLAGGIIFLVIESFKDKVRRAANTLIVLGLASALTVLALGGSELRFILILLPFIVLVMSYGLVRLAGEIESKKGSGWARVVWAAVFLLLAWEFAYNINSNFLARPVSKNFLIYAEANAASRKLGFNRLERYLRREVLPKKLELKRPKKLLDIDERAVSFAEEYGVIYFFDDSMSWFAHNWYFRKYSNYYGLPMLPWHEQLKELRGVDPFEFFGKLGVKKYYYIYTEDERLVDPKKIDSGTRKTNSDLARIMDGKGAKRQEIKNYLGEVVFKVYELEFK